jgi:hypothetical protein
MADYTTDLVDKGNATDAASGIINGDDISGSLMVATATYTLLGTEISGQTIQVTPPLPAQIVVVPDLCSVSCNDPGTTLTIDVGDADDRDRYADGITLSNGGTVAFASGVAAVTPHRPSSAQSLVAYIDTAASLSAAAKLTFVVVYRGKA